jgi:hypothetical protein
MKVNAKDTSVHVRIHTCIHFWNTYIILNYEREYIKFTQFNPYSTLSQHSDQAPGLLEHGDEARE